MNTSPAFHILKGPLGGHLNYIAYIALPNCIDFFNCSKSINFATAKLPQKYDWLRQHLNAIQSLDNIIDYIYFDNFSISSKKSQSSFRQSFYKTRIPELEKIHNLCNTFKHCIRGRFDTKNQSFIVDSSKTKAKDLANIHLEISVRPAENKVRMAFNTILNTEVTEKVFGYWIDYLNSKQGEK